MVELHREGSAPLALKKKEEVKVTAKLKARGPPEGAEPRCKL